MQSRYSQHPQQPSYASPSRSSFQQPAHPSPSSRFTQRSTLSSRSGGSGGSGGSGEAQSMRSDRTGSSGEYNRNADPAELFVRQERIGPCGDTLLQFTQVLSSLLPQARALSARFTRATRCGRGRLSRSRVRLAFGEHSFESYAGYSTFSCFSVAVIDLEDAEDEIEDIQSEISILSSLDSPFVTKYEGSWLRGTELWIVMEFLQGGSCGDLVCPSSSSSAFAG